MILYKEPCDIRSSFRCHCNKLGVEPPILLELGNNESLLNFVAKGLGAAIVPKIVVENTYDPSLVFKKIEPNSFFRSIDVVFQSKYRKFITLLLKAQQ